GNYRGVVHTTTQESHSTYHSVPYLLEEYYRQVDEARKRLGWTRNGRLASGRTMPTVQINCQQISQQRLRKIVRDFDGILQQDFLDKCNHILDMGYHFD